MDDKQFDKLIETINDNFKLLLALIAIVAGILFGISISLGAELVSDANGNFKFSYTQPESVEIVTNEPIEVEVNDEYNIYEDYLNDTLREQQRDIEEYWEDGYRDYLRGWGVDEDAMRGW